MTEITEISPEIIAKIRQQVIDEIKSDEDKKQALIEAQRQKEKKAREEYISQMKKSKDPWVELIGIGESDEGIKIELEWNASFVKHLRVNGFTGASDDDVVQHYIAILAKNVAEDMTENNDRLEN